MKISPTKQANTHKTGHKTATQKVHGYVKASNVNKQIHTLLPTHTRSMHAYTLTFFFLTGNDTDFIKKGGIVCIKHEH